MKLDVTQLSFLDRKLRGMLVLLEQDTGLEFTLTSLYRIGDTGVHGTLPLRGADIRTRDMAVGEELESKINRQWLYDPARPTKMCAKLHGDGSNLHLHLQVHPNTIQR